VSCGVDVLYCVDTSYLCYGRARASAVIPHRSTQSQSHSQSHTDAYSHSHLRSYLHCRTKYNLNAMSHDTAMGLIRCALTRTVHTRQCLFDCTDALNGFTHSLSLQCTRTCTLRSVSQNTNPHSPLIPSLVIVLCPNVHNALHCAPLLLRFIAV
jgi:hypothetical protein